MKSIFQIFFLTLLTIGGFAHAQRWNPPCQPQVSYFCTGDSFTTSIMVQQVVTCDGRVSQNYVAVYHNRNAAETSALEVCQENLPR